MDNRYKDGINERILIIFNVVSKKNI
jgi:hypothetical protein